MKKKKSIVKLKELPDAWKRMGLLREMGFSYNKIARNFNQTPQHVSKVMQHPRMKDFFKKRKEDHYKRAGSAYYKLLARVEDQIVNGVRELHGVYDKKGRFTPKSVRIRELSVKELEALSKIAGLNTMQISVTTDGDSESKEKEACNKILTHLQGIKRAV